MDKEKRNKIERRDDGIRKIRKEDLGKVLGSLEEEENESSCSCASSAPSSQTSAIT